MRGIVLVLGLLAGAPVAAEPSPLTLEAAVAEALAHNPDVAKAVAASREASWRRLEAASGYLPSIGLAAGDILTTKYTLLGVHFGPQTLEMPEAFPAETIEADASWTFFDGGRSWQLYRAASAGYEAAESDLTWTRFGLERQVRSRWYRAMAAQMLAGVSHENVVTLESHLEVARSGLQNGISTQFDILRIEAQLEEARAEETLAADDVVLARRALAEVMGRDGDPDALEGSLPVPDEAVVPAEADCRTGDRPDLVSLRRRAEAARQAHLSALTSIWCPAVALFANEDFYKYRDFSPMIVPNSSFRTAYTVGLRLQWNILAGVAPLAREREASARAAQADEDVKSRTLKAATEASTWRRRYLYNAVLYRARIRSQEKSEESVRIASAGVKAGVRTNSETLDAELELFRARAGVVRAQADAADALLNLEIALGRALPAPRATATPSN